jgi:predicted nucleotidyltransferase
MFDELANITEDIRRGRYAKAPVVFLAGSLVRGEGTSTSDLDLVVVFDRLPNAFRESFWHETKPIEHSILRFQSGTSMKLKITAIKLPTQSAI